MMEEGTQQITLQGRVMTFIVILVVLLISAFTAVQIRNQMKTMTDYNAYRARVSALFVKTTLERMLDKISPEADIGSLFNDTLASFTRGGLIEKGTVIAEYDNIIASTEPLLLGQRTSPEEALRIRDLFDVKEKSGGTLSYVDKPAKMLFMYIPVRSPGAKRYVMRAVFSLGNFQEALEQVYIPIIFTALVVVATGIFFGFMLSRNVIGPITILNDATKDIASGNLDMKVDMPTGDELEELADTFNDMTVALKKMRERAENANPLTKLPGNNVIREEVERRIREGRKFVVVHSDLDNFKAFNDKYGINRGDEAIKITSDVLQEGLQTKGAANDFVGHEGGDDFVFVTIPEKADEVTSYIIKEFDKRIRALYAEEDRKKGRIIATGRDGKVHEFPIMTISLSGVTNEYRPIDSYAEVTNIAAEVKKKVKAAEKSIFILDKRRGGR